MCIAATWHAICMLRFHFRLYCLVYPLIIIVFRAYSLVIRVFRHTNNVGIWIVLCFIEKTMVLFPPQKNEEQIIHKKRIKCNKRNAICLMTCVKKRAKTNNINRILVNNNISRKKYINDTEQTKSQIVCTHNPTNYLQHEPFWNRRTLTWLCCFSSH